MIITDISDVKQRLDNQSWYMVQVERYVINSFLVSSGFCRLLIIFLNSLESYQDPHNVGPDLDRNNWTL